MSNKICINKKVFLMLCIVIMIFLLSLLTNSIIKNRTTYKSEAAPIKIYGGTEVTDPNKWPFMVRTFNAFEGDSYVSLYGECDGTLIAPRWVLTAAHCNISPLIGKIFIGSNNLKAGLTPYAMEKFIIYPDYQCYDTKCDDDINDIALIKLKNAVNDIQTISLNTTSTFNTEGEGVLEVLLGWGRIENYEKTDILRQAVVPVLLNKTANKKDWYNNHLLPSEIASGYPKGGVGQCHGDSGGPNIVWDGNKWIQIGIISWSIFDDSSFHKLNCGVPKKPGVGTRLSYSGVIRGKSVNYIQWIKDTIKKETGETYTGVGTFKGKDLTYQEKSEFIKRIWINRELETDSLQPH